MANTDIKSFSEGLLAEVQKNRDVVKKLNVHDFSSVDSTISIVGADGAKQGSITPPAGVANIKVGQIFSIKIAPPADPLNTPQDDYQMVMSGSYLWKDKKGTDIFNWSEMKNNVANGDKLVLVRLPDTGGFKNYELHKWEIASSASGHWETIDQTTYDFSQITEPVKVRITASDLSHTTFKVISYLQVYGTTHSFATGLMSHIEGDITKLKVFTIHWKSTYTNKNDIKVSAQNGENVGVVEHFAQITKFEIWKES